MSCQTVPPQTALSPTQTALPATAQIQIEPTPTQASTLSGRLLFSSRRIDTNGDGFVQVPDAIHIYQLDLESGRLTQITKADAYHTSPAWSPDGSQIAFISTQSGDVDLFTMQADGSAMTQQTFDLARVSSPSWSPDGEAILFSGGNSDAPNLYQLRVETGEIHQLTETLSADLSPSWSENGRFILYHSINSEGNSTGTLFDVEAEQSHPLTLEDGEMFAMQNLQWRPQQPNQLTAQGVNDDQDTILFFELVWDGERPFLQKQPLTIAPASDYVWLDAQTVIVAWSQQESSELIYLTMPENITGLIQVDPNSDNMQQLTRDTFYESNLEWRP